MRVYPDKVGCRGFVASSMMRLPKICISPMPDSFSCYSQDQGISRVCTYQLLSYFKVIYFNLQKRASISYTIHLNPKYVAS